MSHIRRNWRSLWRQVLRGLPWSLAAMASLSPLLLAYQQSNRFNDDAYITLTYAKNLASGNGFVYNHPPPTYGTTSPLTVLLVGSGGALFPHVDLTFLAALLTAMAWVGSAWVFILWRNSFSLTLWESVLVALFLLGNMVQYWGGENALFTFLLVLTVALSLSRRWFVAGLCAGLLCLARGEGALIGPILAAVAVADHRRRDPGVRCRQLMYPLLLIAAGFAAVTVPWSAYAWASFGTMTPNTLVAKMAQGQADPTRLFHHTLANDLSQWGKDVLFFAPALHWGLWVLAGLGLWSILAKRRHLLPLIAWTALYVLSYTLLRVPGYAWWYHLPVRWTWGLCVAIGTLESCRLIQALGNHSAQGAIARRVTIVVALSVLVAWTSGHIQQAITHHGDGRAANYLRVTSYINQHAAPDASVLAGEIGYLGYYTNNRIIDAAALIDLRNLGKTWEELVIEYRPDFCIVRPDRRHKASERLSFGSVGYALAARFSKSGMNIFLYVRDDVNPGQPNSVR